MTLRATGYDLLEGGELTIDSSAILILLLLLGALVGALFYLFRAPRPDGLAIEDLGRERPKQPAPRSSRDSTGIFISYRRQDEPNFAGRLYDKLATRFGKSNVFIDVDTIELGLDFADAISQSLAKCRVLIVVIGREWLSVTDGAGERRLNNPDDYVRLEVESALHRQIRVIPVLVEGAVVPKSSDLPEMMTSLARRNGIAVSHASFGSDVDRLIETLDRIMKAKHA